MRKVEKIVVEKILELIEKKQTLPWKTSWIIETPRNGFTGRAYHGINQLTLSWLNEYEHNLWFTFYQVKQLNGTIKKGSKAIPVVFYNVSYYDKEKQCYVNDTTEYEDNSILEKRTTLRYYNVFNLDQVILPPNKKEEIIAKYKPKNHNIDINEIDKVINFKNAPRVVYGQHNPCYTPKLHSIFMPPANQFTKKEAFFQTLFHELVHSTGHESILNRDMECLNKNDHKYSFEELIAEIGSCFLMQHYGLEFENLKQSAYYIEHWLKNLKNNPHWIFKAAAQAQKAKDWIISTSKVKKEQKEKVQK